MMSRIAREGTRRWLRMTVACAALVFAAACHEAVPTGAVTAGKVAADGLPFYGKKTQVYGYVSSPEVGGAFSISDGVAGTASLPIVMKTANAGVTMGEKVLVDGTPTAFDAGRVKSDYGIELAEEVTRGWHNRPVVIADGVRKLD